MPFLAGGNLVDASGNALVDASSASLGEPDLAVTVRNGALFAATQPWDDLWRWVRDRLEGDTAGFVEWIFEMTETADIVAKLGRILDNMEDYFSPTSLDSVTYRGKTASYSGWTVNKLLGAISDLQNDTTEGHLATLVDILAAVNALGTPQWPEDPPDWYTAPTPPDLSGIPADVWAWMANVNEPGMVNGGEETGAIMTDLMTYINWMAGYEGLPIPDRPYFKVVVPRSASMRSYLESWLNESSTSELPVLDLSLVQSDDTVLSFLEREYSGYSWTTLGPGSWPSGGNVWLAGPVGACYYRCTLTDADLGLAAARTALPINTTINISIPPTIDPERFTEVPGTLIEFDAPFVSNTPCDGLRFTTSTHGGGVKGFDVGDYTALTGAGVVGFLDDTGTPEKFQYINWDHGILLPLTMKHAAGFIWSSNVSLNGTVTPFTLEPVEE